ncbi:hypothetical protein PSTT_14876 [Puccinia striiformis]|uniref:Uncharacterized protein n=1 Tax=Puccinia striiformis TaxID=27350 RepID=A0A2S4UKA0_9BASI|nr:hypothetical protein PSTT_14876 [Puccinia striiformis]
MADQTSTTTASYKIRLNSTNYLGWIVQMQAKFRQLGCLDVILGRSIKPEEPDKQATWTEKNETAYFAIIDHVNIEHMTLIGGAVPPNQQFDGRFVWTFLKSKYAANDDVAKLVALEAFNELEFTTIPAFITTSFRDIITMGFAAENFESLLRRLENYGAQNRIGTDLDNRPDQAALLTLSVNQLSCPSCKKSFKTQ